MQWLDIELPPAQVQCVYCATQGSFNHWGSFDYSGQEFALFKCPACESLIYHPGGFVAPITQPYTDAYKEAIRRSIQYYFETGYSADFVTMCALFALAGVPKSQRKDHVFVDVGAGPGVGSHFVQTLFDIETLVIEPSYSGELGKKILGIEIHNAFFEELPEDVLKRLAGKPTLLHLNSVIEHLMDPGLVIRQLMERTEISAIAAVVPHAPGIDKAAAFSMMIPYLAPGDHQHLPTAEGMRRFYRSLGFPNCEVVTHGPLLVAIGSKKRIKLPTQAEMDEARDAFLGRLLDHPNQHVAMGAAARLLPLAVGHQIQPLLENLRAQMVKARVEPVRLLAVLKNPDSNWDDIPFHLPATGYWAAADALMLGSTDRALAWLDVVDAFAERMWKDHPHFAMQSVDYVWEGRLLRSNTLITQAEKWARTVIDSESDRVFCARAEQIQRARETLARLGCLPSVSVSVFGSPAVAQVPTPESTSPAETLAVLEEPAR
jgi:hypothetical protein